MTLLCDNAELGTLMLIMLLEPILVPQLFALALVVAKNLPSICPWPALSFPVLEKLFASAGLTERFRRCCVSALHRLWSPKRRLVGIVPNPYSIIKASVEALINYLPKLHHCNPLPFECKCLLR